MSEHEPSSESLLVAAVRDCARQKDGNQRDFATRLDIHPTTISRWMKGATAIPKNAYPLLAVELELPESALPVLAALTIKQTCQLIIDRGITPPA